MEYSTDFGYTWQLVRETCLPGDVRCQQLTDSSIFFGPLTWSRFVYSLEHVGPAKYASKYISNIDVNENFIEIKIYIMILKELFSYFDITCIYFLFRYVRFRWHQSPTSEGGDLHRWSIRNVYIGEACPHNCLGRGYCMGGECHCDHQYTGNYCQILLQDNVVRIS